MAYNNQSSTSEYNSISAKEDMLEKLSFMSDVLQILNTYLLTKQASNNDIFHELQGQDNILNGEILERLKIIENKLDKLIKEKT